MPAGDPVERAPRTVQLEPAAPFVLRIGEVGGGPAERTCATAAAPDDPPVGEHRRADARSDGNEQHILQLRGDAGRSLGQQREMGVIAERHVDAGKATSEVEAVEVRQIGDPAAGRPLGQPRDRKTEARGAVLLELAPEQRDEFVERARRRPCADRADFGRIVDRRNPRATVGAAEIDGENAFAHPLIPDATIKSTKKRCKSTNSSTGGKTASVAAGHDQPGVHRSAIVAEEPRERDDDRILLGIALEHGQRPEVAVPVVDEGEQGQNSEGREHRRRHDLEYNADFGRPVESSGFDQFVRDALDELPHEEDAEGVGQVGRSIGVARRPGSTVSAAKRRCASSEQGQWE